MSSPDALQPVAARVGRYTLRYTVAHGGMAEVYLAQLGGAHGFEKWVAVKIIHPHLSKDRKFVTMFLDEARLTSRLVHPNVCHVIDFGEHQGVPYLVMEYLHGETLSSVIHAGWRASGLPHWIAARVVADAARGLHTAHEMRGPDGTVIGLVHRDVSPQNILVLYDGPGKIMDFGVAQADGRETLSAAGELKGKIAYMAPEQLRGQRADRRTDVWALGVVLWEATCGKRLFRSGSEGATVAMVLERPIPSPSELVPGYPEELEAVVMSALERDLGKRTPTAAAVANALERWLATASAATGKLYGTTQVAEWMEERFADRRSARDTLLSVAPEPSAAIPEIELASERTLGSQVSSGIEGPAAPRLDRRGLAGLLGVAGVLVVAAVLAAVAWPRGGAPSGTPVSPAPSTPVVPPVSAHGPSASTTPVVAPVPPAELAPTPPTTPNTPTSATPSTTTAPRPVRRTPPHASSGTLNLLAVPAAEVSFHGRSLGRTPLVGVELPSGRQTLSLRALGSGARQDVTVTIRPGQRTMQSVSIR